MSVTGALSRWSRGLGVRLLLVNVVVVLVPWAGLEYARWHERRLLAMLEQGMRDQATVVQAVAEASLAEGEPLASDRLGVALRSAAVSTRTRVRVLDAVGATVIDSHASGPPEGPEPPAPTVWGSLGDSSTTVTMRRSSSSSEPRWPEVPERIEVRRALDEGASTAMTRVRDREPQVFLFLAEPIHDREHIVGAVYVTRSTQPVLEQMHRLRQSLVRLLLASLALTLLVTIALAWTIGRPIERLAAAARRIARGERGVVVPQGGPTQVRDLASGVAALVREQDQRMRYIEGFAADVAHELKSPLTAIRGAAELLESEPEPAQRARFLANIVGDAERMDRLVSRLLELSRIDAEQKPLTDVALDPLIARVLERTDAPEQPVVQAGRRGAVVRGREHDLERALLNLVENALRFAPASSTVTISVEDAPSGMVSITVTDEGPGVPEAYRDKVFDRFFTTDAERTGTGLGLAIVRSVAERAGGTATLRPGERGACFVMSLHPGARQDGSRR